MKGSREAGALKVFISNPSAGINRIRFKELAVCLSARSAIAGHPHEIVIFANKPACRLQAPRRTDDGVSAIDCGAEMGDVVGRSLESQSPE